MTNRRNDWSESAIIVSRIPMSFARIRPPFVGSWGLSGPRVLALTFMAASKGHSSKYFSAVFGWSQAWGIPSTTATGLLISVLVSKVTASQMIPAVIMRDWAAISVPVAHEEPFPIVTRCHPASSLVRWFGPITFMPPIMPSYGIPVTSHPHELEVRSLWHHVEHGRWRRRSNSDSHGSLRIQDRDHN